MYLVGFVLYVVLCVGVAWGLAVAITHRAREGWPRWVVAAVLAPIVFLLPLADEIVGHFQFERLCAAAKDVKIHGTIPVGEDLYTPEGKWRLGLVGAADFVLPEKDRESFRLQKIVDSYVRWDLGRAQEVPAAILIQRYENKIYDVKTGRLLAEWQKYGAYGGWFGRNVIADRLIVRPQCMPEIVLRSKIDQALLKFTKPSEAAR